MNWIIVAWTTLNLPEPNVKFAKGCAVQWFEQVWMRRTTPNFFPCAVTGSEALWNQPVLIVPSVVQWFEEVQIIGYSRCSLYSAVVQGLVQFEPPWTSLNLPELTWTPQRTCLKLSIRVVQSYWTCLNHSQNCDSFNFLLLWQLLNQLLMARFHPVVWDIVANIPFYLMKVSPSFNPNPRSCFSEVDLNLETCKTTTEKDVIRLRRLFHFDRDRVIGDTYLWIHNTFTKTCLNKIRFIIWAQGDKLSPQDVTKQTQVQFT